MFVFFLLENTWIVAGKRLKCTMSTFRMHHRYRSVFTLRRPSDMSKSNGQELFAEQYWKYLHVQYILSRSSLSLFMDLYNELYANEELLHDPKENIYTSLSQLHELLEGSSNTLCLLWEFWNSCFIKSVTSCDHFQCILLIIYLYWGQFLKQKNTQPNNPLPVCQGMPHNSILGETEVSQEHALEGNCWNYPGRTFDQETEHRKQQRKSVNESVHL